MFTDRLAVGIDFRVTNAGHIELTNLGFESVYSNTAMTVHPELVRPWHEYVVAALRARFLFRRDVNYIVREHRVQIVDSSTGRIFADRSWSDGMHQAVEAKEGLRISPENIPLARITRQRFYRYYQSLGGMTGTATGCEHEFAAVYGLPIAVVPLRLTSKRSLLPERICLTRAEKLAAVADETAALCQRGRAVLIGTLSIADSVDVAQQLTARGLDFQLLNGVQDADEASVIQQAGQPGAITVATNLAGRGTDIALAPKVTAEGGLHVIVFDSHLYSRVDRQLIGRSARCGDPGTARRFFSADDALLRDQASWLARAIQRWDRDGRRGKPEITNRLVRIQAEQHRRATSLRWQLLQADHEDAKLFSDPSSAPERCWQL
jgi:preprotein translocase subunit SecA